MSQDDLFDRLEASRARLRPVAAGPPGDDDLFNRLEASRTRLVEPTLADTAIGFGLRVVPTVVGGTLAAGAASPSGPGAILAGMAGGGAGAALGEAGAEAYEKWRGIRKVFNPAQIATQGAIGAIPLARTATGVKGLLQAGAQGAGLGAAADVGTRWAEGAEITPESTLKGAAIGAVFGGGTHAALAGLRRLRGSAGPVTSGEGGEASQTALADLLRGGKTVPGPSYRRTEAGTELLPVAERRPDLAAAWQKGGAVAPDPLAPQPRGSFGAYATRDAAIQAEALADREAVAAELQAQRRAGDLRREPVNVGADLERAAAVQAKAEGEVRAQAAARQAEVDAGAKDLDEFLGADSGNAARRAEADAIVEAYERQKAELANRPAPSPAEAETLQAGVRQPGVTPAAETLLAERGARLEPDKAARRALRKRLGMPVDTVEPSFGRYLGIAGEAAGVNEGRVVAALTVEERAQLDAVRRLVAEEPPTWIASGAGNGEQSALQPLYDRARELGGNPKWTNADIRKGMADLRSGKENIYGRAGLEASKEMLPTSPISIHDAPEVEGFAAPDPEIERARLLEYLEASKAKDAAERQRAAEAAFLDTTPGPPVVPAAAKPNVLANYSSYGRAKAAAEKLTAEGRPARVAASHDPTWFDVVADGGVPESIRDVGEPALIPDVAYGPDVPDAPIVGPREPGQEGFSTPRVAATIAGATTGGLGGATQGDTPEARAKNALLGILAGGAMGAGSMAAIERLAGRGGETVLGRITAPTAKEEAAATRALEAKSANIVERPQWGMSDVDRYIAAKRLPSARTIEPPDLLLKRGIEKYPEAIRPILQNVLNRGDDPTQAALDPGFAQQRRHVQPIARTEALADTIQVDLSKPGRPGVAMNAEDLKAHSNVRAALATRVADLAAELKSEGIGPGQAQGGLTDAQTAKLMQFATTERALSYVSQTFEGAKAEAGRSLRILRELSRQAPGDMQVMRDVLRRGRFDKQLLELTDVWATIDKNDPQAVYKMMKDVQKRSKIDAVTGYWMANVLSGIKTQERNMFGNASRFVTGIATKGVAAGPLDLIKSTLTGSERKIYSTEALHDLQGAYHSAGKAWNDFWFTLKNGFSEEWLNTAVDLEQGFSPRPEFKSILGMRVPEGANPGNWPGRFLDAMDRGFYQLNTGAELYSQSYSQARREATRLKLGGKAWDDFMANRMVEMRANPDLALQQSVHQAGLEATYRETEGKFGQLLQQMRREVPGMTFVMPFIKTVSNIMRQGYEYTPVSGLVKGGKALLGNEQAWNRAGGGTREATTMQAKALLGTAASGMFAYWAATGRMSGSGPTDRATRSQLMATGWRPNSVKLALPDAVASALGASKSADGEYWVNYSLAQPISIPMSLVANAYEAWSEVSGNQLKRNTSQAASQIAAQTLSRVAKSALNQSYLQGLFTFADAINNGQLSAEKFIEQVAQGFVPGAGMLRNVTQAVDPVIRDPEGIGQALAANVPGLSSKVSPRLGRFGEPIERSGTPLRRFLGVPEVEPTTSDWIDKELNRLGVSVGTPTDRITLPEWMPSGSRKITEEQSLALREARGKGTRAQLALVMGSPGYAKLPDWAKVQLAQRAVRAGASRASTAGRASMILNRPGLLKQLMAPSERVADRSYAPGQRKGT